MSDEPEMPPTPQDNSEKLQEVAANDTTIVPGSAGLDAEQRVAMRDKPLGRPANDIDATVARLFVASWESLSGNEIRLRGFIDEEPQFSRGLSESESRARSVLSPLMARLAARLGQGGAPSSSQIGRETIPIYRIDGDGLVPNRVADETPPRAAGSARSGEDGAVAVASAAVSAEPDGGLPDLPAEEEFGIAEPLETLGFDEAVLSLSRAARLQQSDPQRLAALMLGHAGPFFAHRHGQVDGERLVDGAVMVLVPVSEQKRISAGIFHVVPAIRSELKGGLYRAGDGLTEGEITSLAAIATLLSNAIDDLPDRVAYESRSVIYYHEVILELLRRPEALEKSQSDRFLRLTEQATNNIAASLGRLRRRPRAGKNIAGQFPHLIRDLIAVSSSIGKSEPVRPGSVLSEVAQSLDLPGTITAKQVEYDIREWYPRLDSAGMVQLDEDRTEHGFLVAWRHVVTGMLRAANRLGTRASSALFNAGVQLLRMDEDGFGELRGVANGCGLLVAFLIADSDRQALGEFDGSDCAVNLMGSISAWIGSGADSVPEDEIFGLIRALRGAIERGLIRGGDATRISNSIDSILQALPGRAPGRGRDEPLLVEAVRDYLRAIAGRHDLRISDEPELAELATLLRVSFREKLTESLRDSIVRMHPELGGKDDLLRDYVVGYLEQLMERSGNPVAELREIYAGRIYAVDGRHVQDIGPLVAAGLMTEEEWSEQCREALSIGSEPNFETAFAKGFEDMARRRARPAAPGPKIASPDPAPVTTAAAPEPAPRVEGMASLLDAMMSQMSETEKAEFLKGLLLARAPWHDETPDAE